MDEKEEEEKKDSGKEEENMKRGGGFVANLINTAKTVKQIPPTSSPSTSSSASATASTSTSSKSRSAFSSLSFTWSKTKRTPRFDLSRWKKANAETRTGRVKKIEGAVSNDKVSGEEKSACDSQSQEMASAMAGISQRTRGGSTYQRLWRPSRFGCSEEASRGFAFTVMSYNVLADEYARQMRWELYRNVPDTNLSWDMRYPRLQSEILSHSPDIVCLQEVQEEHFHNSFKRDLETKAGYASIFKKKTGAKVDGCAIFYKPDKFDLEDFLSVEYKQPNIDILDRDNIALMAKFRPKITGKTEDCLVIATTHLLYNPKRVDVRMAQTVLLLAELDRFCSYQRFGEKRRHPCIVSGDFNLDPSSPVFSLLASGIVDCSEARMKRGSRKVQLVQKGRSFLPEKLGITESCRHADVDHPRLYNSERPKRVNEGSKNCENEKMEVEEREIVAPSSVLTHDLHLRSVYETGKFGEVTTFQNQWLAVDHIFYSTVPSPKYGKDVEGKLKLLGRLGLLTNIQCGKLGRLPTEHFPSDHLPLLAKFMLKQ